MVTDESPSVKTGREHSKAPKQAAASIVSEAIPEAGRLSVLGTRCLALLESYKSGRLHRALFQESSLPDGHATRVEISSLTNEIFDGGQGKPSHWR